MVSTWLSDCNMQDPLGSSRVFLGPIRIYAAWSRSAGSGAGEDPNFILDRRLLSTPPEIPCIHKT
jgi:hypothetical protein